MRYLLAELIRFIYERLNMTFQRVSTFVPVKGASNTAPSEDHLVLRQRPCFICQNILNLSQIFTDCCAGSY
jgi:hypothetical protein